MRRKLRTWYVFPTDVNLYLSALEESCAACLWACKEDIKESETAHMSLRKASL